MKRYEIYVMKSLYTRQTDRQTAGRTLFNALMRGIMTYPYNVWPDDTRNSDNKPFSCIIHIITTYYSS